VDDRPLVSVVTPSLDQGRYLEAAIRSVGDQDYPRIEHIVVDGGSTDGTLDVLRRHPGVRWLSEPDDGQADAINKGFALATGEIFAWLNADDVYLPGAVAAAVDALTASGAVLVYGGWRQIDEAGLTVRDVAVQPFDYRELLEVRNMIAQPAAFFTRAAFEAAGGLDPGYRYALDYELWLRLCRLGEVRTIDRPLASFRLHGSSKTVASYGEFWPETHRASRRHGGRYLSPMWRRSLPERRPWLLRLVVVGRHVRRGEVRAILHGVGRRLGRTARRAEPRSTIAGVRNGSDSASVVVAGRAIGGGAPCFVIAEAGVNHNGDPELARRLVEAAADAGADAVKFQTFRAAGVVSPDAPKADYQRVTTDEAESQAAMLRRLELGDEIHRELKELAEARGLVFLSTPFDPASVELLDSLGVAAFKVSSTDLTNLPLLREIAGRGRPVVLSTGIGDLAEVERAVATVRERSTAGIVLLHCVSAYPAPAGEANLRAMATLADRFGVPTGFSDHTEGTDVALAAVALGASVLEKHFTLDRTLAGPDHRASLEPDELTGLVASVRRVESALGSGVKERTVSEEANRAAVRRSLAAAVPLRAGTVVTAELLTALRPGTGISPAAIDEVVGRRLRRDVAESQLLDPADLE
jgi:N-acetylneuraminate synthase/N,N'-diacetyllegionaminate synthase